MLKKTMLFAIFVCGMVIQLLSQVTYAQNIDNPVLWNTLGSDSELQNSLVGPSLIALQTLTYSATMNGSGALSDNDDAIIQIPSSVMNSAEGTISLWVKFVSVPASYPNATEHLFLFSSEISQRFTSNDGLAHSGWLSLAGGNRVYGINSFGTTSTSSLGINDEMVLMTLRWDSMGVAGHGTEKIVFFRNGIKVGTYVDGGSAWPTSFSSDLMLNEARYNPSLASGTVDLNLIYDDIMVYDRSLSDQDVVDLYNGMLPQITILSGFVNDAFTGEPLNNVMVEVAGIVEYTDLTGFYEITNIPDPDFTADFSGSPRGGIAPITVQFSDLSADGIQSLDAFLDGYLDFHTRLVIPPDISTRFDFSMSPSLNTGSMRFVLNWAAEPRDLDSHLTTPEIFGIAYHVYFGNLGSDVMPPYARLDFDDVTGFGPETVTIYQFYEGTYKYYIHLYTGDGTPLTGSGAIVQIYTDIGLISTVNVPATGTGIYWYVCDIDGATGAVTLINEIVDLEPTSLSPGITGVMKESSNQERSAVQEASINVLDWQWDFGDGGSSTLQNPMHTYNEQGSYTVSLTINTDMGSFTETKLDYINVEIDRDSASSRILSISDVPDDQGKQVLVVWENSLLEGNPVEPSVISYSLWRLVDAPGMQGQGERGNLIEKNALIISDFEQPIELTINSEVWSFITSMPIEGFDRYSYVAPTLGDSTADGIFWSTFMVSAHTSDPNVFFHSNPDSGYSVDNLAPSAPTGLVASVTINNEVSLMWDEPMDADFDYFVVYRSLESGFDPTQTAPLVQTIDIQYVDTDITIGENYYYRLSALDENGNESEFSEEVSAIITSVNGEQTGLPDTYSLGQNYPNPFNPETVINYSIPSSGNLRLSIINLRGELVAMLVDEYQVIGNYRVKWNASDIPSGIYFYRLQSGNFVQTRKMVLLK